MLRVERERTGSVSNNTDRELGADYPGIKGRVKLQKRERRRRRTAPRGWERYTITQRLGPVKPWKDRNYSFVAILNKKEGPAEVLRLQAIREV